MTLEQYRQQFEQSVNRSVSMPIAGALVWLMVALVSTQLSEYMGILVLLFASGGIFPLALLIAKVRGEDLLSATNPLSKLMGSAVLMVNLLWAVHIPLFIYHPQFVPLSLGVALGIHWIIYSWIVQHPLGIVHAILRTLLVVAAWFIFPSQSVLAIGLAIVLVYCISITQMLTRSITVKAMPKTVN
ncbi:hypothetical protein KJY73_13135 [Bowmanella sp. Y26]|uniref:DUF7010 family protein n=1 Tax=Bowmanella yangjiangensis TaxID=2811230 RepID=UPI001BDBD34F|nr:hypothetical protein [Bowmanella yangjiangensis]MBT1064527.1 hypothetical protein [Bowmanella yangjiangensis]